MPKLSQVHTWNILYRSSHIKAVFRYWLLPETEINKWKWFGWELRKYHNFLFFCLLQHTTENMFRIIYTQLSQAAMFFDHIYKALDQGDLKNQLDVIIWENLSILCELKIVLLKINQNQSIPENLSIIDSFPNSMSIYQRNARCLSIIFKYKSLLSGHLEWYRRNQAHTNSTNTTK